MYKFYNFKYLYRNVHSPVGNTGVVTLFTYLAVQLTHGLYNWIIKVCSLRVENKSFFVSKICTICHYLQFPYKSE